MRILPCAGRRVNAVLSSSLWRMMVFHFLARLCFKKRGQPPERSRPLEIYALEFALGFEGYELRAVGDNDMVYQLDAEDFASVIEPPGDGDVVL